ncbi:sensor histidine kinase [Roseibacillus persicicus]|uniref:sensor histidine kinase n=1 Tax=Roseibacillus persicicus TaxID=454148 RepID=UPI00281064CB|nr:sensor histidine kinase [Roseibacillus persicicus]MDQ8190461.1 sensor histidine kinase [Roseibacillus persicicus]
MAGEPLRSIAEIRELSAEDAGQKLAVELEAKITLIGYLRSGGFIHDGENGIYIHFNNKGQVPAEVRPGSVVRIQGATVPGGFTPHIIAKEVQLLKQEAPLVPDELDRTRLFQSDQDCEWVWFSGTLMEVSDFSERPYLFIKVWWHSRALIIRVIKSPETQKILEGLMHHRVKVSAIVATRSNQERQMTMRYFQLPSMRDIELIESPPGEVIPIGQILQKDAFDEEPVAAEGIVTHSDGKTVYLRGDEGCLRVRLPKSRSLELGAEVRVEGYSLPGAFGPDLLAYSLTPTDRRAEVLPRPFPLENDVYTAGLQNDLVRLSAKVLSVAASDKLTIIHCLADGEPFELYLSGPANLGREIAAGCELEITGICELKSDEPNPTVASVTDRFQIKARNIDDLIVLQAAPWWSAGRLLVALSLFSAACLLAVVWGLSLRRRVASQTAIISEQIEKEAAHKERQHFARELHDTLQQNLTGISMQVENAQLQFETQSREKSEENLERIHQLIVECQQETREAISQLRGAATTRGSLAIFVEDSMRERARVAEVKFEVETIGQPKPYDSFTVRHILRILHEAFVNAINHSQANSIKLIFDYQDEQLVTTLSDDGRGFDPRTVETEGHFGLIGMRERAELIGAELQLDSSRNKGTRISLKVSASNQQLETV